MTKEMIKAIRMVKGWNPDLRVKLQCNHHDLRDWIEDNRIGILGIDMAFKPHIDDPDWRRYNKKIDHAVACVIGGTVYYDGDI